MTRLSDFCFAFSGFSWFAYFTEHVNDMVYSVERLNSLVGAARVDLEAFKSREQHHRQSKLEQTWYRSCAPTKLSRFVISRHDDSMVTFV